MAFAPRARTLVAVASAVALSRPLAIAHNDDQNRRRPTPLSAVFRAFFVYSLCSVPPLVDHSPRILDTLTSIPLVSTVTNAVVRRTFYAQFVGGDTARETLPVLEQLRRDNKGALFAYSVEDDEDATGANEGSAYKRRVNETIRCIDVAADFEDAHPSSSRKTWVAVKLSALVPSAEPLLLLSSYLDTTRPALKGTPVPFPGHARPSDLAVLDPRGGAPIIGELSARDIGVLRDLRDDLVRICSHAQRRGVKVIIDAEYTWWQPAIDAYTLALQRAFNRGHGVQPLVYGTFQAYLRRTHAQLTHALADAKAEGYSLGVKLVRGAYHPHELARHARLPVTGHSAPAVAPGLSIDTPPPVWERIEDTDAQYAACTKLLLDAVASDVKSSSPSSSWFSRSPASAKTPSIGVLFGTHNPQSCDIIVHGLVARGLAVPEPDADGVVRIDEAVAERVAIGQLYGMCDWLTNALVDRVRAPSPFVIKYVPYGALSEVMPYLSRRAIENKSVLGGRGGAREERRRAMDELRERVLGRN
ncbi:FAD-linked oxidoreductase [Auricularia subglabra TFB-10046 SS5]|nr:FAD-linked oxidoreductase [Auricularia subglabra TFB-10046 SS5]